MKKEKLKQSVQEYEQQGLEKYAHELETGATKGVPTARDFILANKDRFEKTSVDQWLIEFAKLHVEAALKAALEDSPTGSSTDIPSYDEVEDAILNAYPLENIK